MVQVSEILKPNKFKIILSALVLMPIFAILIAISDPYFWIYVSNYKFYSFFNQINWILLILVSLLLSYLLSSLIDTYIPNKNVKLTIAILSGFITLIIIYLFYKMVSEPVICDPVHKPSQGANYDSKLLNDISVDKKSVEESLKQCLEKLGK